MDYTKLLLRSIPRTLPSLFSCFFNHANPRMRREDWSSGKTFERNSLTLMNTLSSVNLVGRPKNNPRSFFSTSILQSAPRVAGAFSVFAEAEWEFAAWKEAMPPAGGGG
ncbi:MAG: hypothetical protein B6D68_03815 [spirochete symbiont of Stewartia floridana]|nr:MAG: hypothetical protein B6D68_03815 [spirochete symbiont of Stewartia floridana]